MDLKDIQKKLKVLRDKIRADGCITPESENNLKNILNETLSSAHEELSSIQEKLTATMSMRAGNDNILSDDQKHRLRLMEKTGTGSLTVH